MAKRISWKCWTDDEIKLSKFPRISHADTYRSNLADSQSRADYLPTNSLGIASISNRETNNGYAATRRVNRAFVSDLAEGRVERNSWDAKAKPISENHYASGSYLSTRSPPPRENPPPAPMEKDYQVTGTNYVEHYVSETEHNNPDFRWDLIDWLLWFSLVKELLMWLR